jgi:hypothetical protein
MGHSCALTPSGSPGEATLIEQRNDHAAPIPRNVRDHNRQAKQNGGVRLVICELPVASPWLNNIEPCWRHARKAIMEPDRKLTAGEITGRVCDHFGCELLPYLQAKSPAEEDLVPF